MFSSCLGTVYYVHSYYSSPLPHTFLLSTTQFSCTFIYTYIEYCYMYTTTCTCPNPSLFSLTWYSEDMQGLFTPFTEAYSGDSEVAKSLYQSWRLKTITLANIAGRGDISLPPQIKFLILIRNIFKWISVDVMFVYPHNNND